MVGFASGIEAEEVPMVTGRMLCFGNFDIVGVILAYTEFATAPLERLAPVPVPRFNAPPAALGRRIQEQLVDLLAAEKIRPVVGGTWSFADLPQALEAMESRTTIGRIVIDR